MNKKVIFIIHIAILALSLNVFGQTQEIHVEKNHDKIEIAGGVAGVSMALGNEVAVRQSVLDQIKVIRANEDKIAFLQGQIQFINKSMSPDKITQENLKKIADYNKTIASAKIKNRTIAKEILKLKRTGSGSSLLIGGVGVLLLVKQTNKYFSVKNQQILKVQQPPAFDSSADLNIDQTPMDTWADL